MRPRGDAFAVLPAIAFVVLFALLPVVILFASVLSTTGGLAGLSSTLSDPLNRASIVNSLVQGGLSAVLAVAVGYPVGIFFGRYDWPGRAALRSFLLVPFLLPSLVVVFGILDLFGPAGLAASSVPALSVLGTGLPAIVAANLFFNVPIVVLFTTTGAEGASAALEETVATLGGSPWRAYRDAWGGPTWVGAAVGGLVTFLFSALSFAPPLLLCGSRCYTVEARIWSLDQLLLSPEAAGVLAFVMVLLFLLPTVLYLLLLGRLRAAPGGPTRRKPLSRRDPLAVGLAALSTAVVGAVFVLLGSVVYRAVAPGGAAPLGAGWSELFAPTTTGRLGISAFGMVANTLLFATAAAAITLLLGIVLGFVVARRPGRAAALGLLFFLPLLISPVVLAFSLASFWRPLVGGETNVWLLIVLSQAVLALPFALQSLEIPLAGLPPAAREAAETLGARPWGAFLDADLPRVRGGLATAGLFAFALGLGEFTATYFLWIPRYTTLPVALVLLGQDRLFAAENAAVGLLLLLSLAVFAALYWGGRRVEL